MSKAPPILPPYGRALAKAFGLNVITESVLDRLRDGVCFDCDEDAPNCRCTERATIRRNPDGSITWIAKEAR